MRWKVLVAVLAGAPACSFTHGAGGAAGDDMGSGADSGMGSGSGSAAPHLPCQLADPVLELCLDFNDAASLGFDSSVNQHDGVVQGVQAMVRDVVTLQDPAAAFTNNASIVIPGSPTLDLPANANVSIEMWLAPTDRPPGMSMYPVLQQGQYEITMRGDGRVRCTIGNAFADTGAIPTGNHWTHIGCTFDGSNVMAYVDGDLAACASTPAWNPLVPAANVLIGQPFLGGIDNLHVLARTIDDTEMCMLAGRQDCKHDCPDPGPPG
jgi:hypothetical protein